ncbi:MAG: SIS domain-containing protein [Magnetovibrio sp.]|nr:SIS domain-containing protein [Magnetovibrio sp.]
MANTQFHEAYFNRLKQTIDSLDRDAIGNAIDVIRDGWKNGQQFIAFGNGGSGLAALHYVHDWNKGITDATGIPFRGRTLNDNIGLVTAFGNDVSYDDIFSEQLKSAMHPGDVIMGISGSGNSENVLRAIRYANDHGGITIGLSGYPGGQLETIAQHNVCTNIHDMQISEDLQMVFGHLVMRELCENLEFRS